MGMFAVIGASGLVGGNLTRVLLNQGYPVRAVVHGDTRGIAGLDIETVRADVKLPESLLRAVQGCEIVFDCAGVISLDMHSWTEMEAANTSGTRHVVEACLACGVRRLVYVSSIHAVVQEPLDQPVDEARPRVAGRRYPPYDLSKAAAELEILRGMRRGLECVILRPTAILGPHDFKPSYIGKAILKLAGGRIPALVQGGFDWVDARDVAAGAAQAGLHAASGSSYNLSGHWRTVREVAQQVEQMTGMPAPRFTLPIWVAYLGAPVLGALASFSRTEPIYTPVSLRALHSNQHISHARASRDLGYKPRPFEQTVEEAVHWFAQNGYLGIQ
jgi:dihydroflavonol-4-reductase